MEIVKRSEREAKVGEVKGGERMVKEELKEELINVMECRMERMDRMEKKVKGRKKGKRQCLKLNNGKLSVKQKERK